MATQTKEVGTQEKAVVKWKGEQITVSFHDVKSLICPLATDQETAVFLKTCQSLNLNPFAKEIYLIKYAERDKAAMVIAIDSYLKAAEANDNYNGCEAGIILKESPGKLEFREGAFLLEEEMDKLVGGWARVYRKNRDRPAYMAVNIKECLRYTREGRLTQFWTKEKQASMLRKTALKRALVEAFPSLFAGTMSTAEVAEVPEAEYHEIPEGELPPAYERNGEAYWKLWWARQKEKGLSEDDVRGILNISSIKEDWLGDGRTLEEAEEIIAVSLPLVTRAKKLGLGINQVSDMLGMALKEWFAQGKTVDDAAKVLSKKLAKPKVSAAAAEPAKEKLPSYNKCTCPKPVPANEVKVKAASCWHYPGCGGYLCTPPIDCYPGCPHIPLEGAAPQSPGEETDTGPFVQNAEEDGISIDIQWLKEARQTLKWTDETMLSFIVSQYKVSGKTVTEALNRLNRDQAEDFVSQINQKLEQPTSLF